MEYQHGGDIYSQEIDMDYSANINPRGIPEGVKAVLASQLDRLALYPDSSQRKLRKALAAHWQEKHLDVREDDLICGNGAADLIFQLAYGMKPKKAMVLAPGFLEYEQALRAAGCEPEYYELKEEEGFAFFPERLGKELLSRSSMDRPEIIFVCNPNNPTGLAVKKDELAALAEICKNQGILLVTDECFNEFLEEPEEYSLVSQVRENNCLFILKAFTKIYGMAGLRLGYGICSNEKVLEAMRGTTQPWSVSAAAQIAGEAALKEKEYVKESVEEIHREKKYLTEELRKMGFQVWDSMANYIFFKDRAKEYQLYERLKEKKVLIRSCGNYRGLNGTYYRICVKDHRENQAFMEKIKEVNQWQKQL